MNVCRQTGMPGRDFGIAEHLPEAVVGVQNVQCFVYAQADDAAVDIVRDVGQAAFIF